MASAADRPRRRAFGAALLTLALSTPARADECVTQADALHQQGRYDAALARLDTCAGDPSRTLLRGHVLWKLRRHREALTEFRRYLPHARAVERGDVERLTAELDQLIRTRLVVTSVPPGAAVLLDDPEAEPLGVTPLETGVRPGPHQLHLRRAGYRDQQLAIVAEVGKSVRARAVLVAIAPPPRPAPPVEPPPLPPPRRSWLPLILTSGLTVGAGALALGFGLAARSARAELDDTGRCELRAAIRERAITADVMIGLAAAAAVTTGALLVFYYRRPAAEAKPRRVSLDLSGLSLSF